jgi:uncharacterized protein YbjT (DUF2867 family)
MSSDRGTILVTGATGQQGGAVLSQLHRRGSSVRALSRDPQSEKARRLREAGVDVVRGDMTDRDTLDAALLGVTRVFAMATPYNDGGPEEEVVQGKTMGDAARAAGVTQYVYSSVGGAERNSGIPHFESKWEIEGHLRSLGMPLTIFRPVWFFENFATFATQPQGDGFIVPMPLSPDTVLQGLAVSDVGVFVAMAFDDPTRWIGEELELAGDERTGPQYARGLSAELGKPVDYVQIPWESVRSMSEDFYRMYDYFEREGYQADIAALRVVHPRLRTFDQWLAEGNLRGASRQAA